MDTWLITLDRTPERLAAFRTDNPLFSDIKIFHAIDGQALDRAGLIEQNVLDPALDYTPGALGCALSHLSIWTSTLNAGGACTIFEDDAIINEEFATESRNLIETLPENWDLVLWGYNTDAYLTFRSAEIGFFCTSRFDHENLLQHKAEFRTRSVRPTLFGLLRAHGLVGYSISASGIRRLLPHVLPLRPMSVFYPGIEIQKDNTGIDDMMAAIYDTLNAWVAFPPLVLAKNDVKASTVQKR
ncbi:glycosyltransferase family 25 protein [Asaia sp. HN010]|uniref:glycosyltransferase family 25 protein n=1 Tax=Asaia sp. HN010 TaxID=3081233 RepID=UPI00301744EA